MWMTLVMSAAGERAGTCPASSGMAGICVFDPNVNCLRDTECAQGEKCCSEGCGKVCKKAVAATPTVHAGTCPAPTSEFGICILLPNACGGDVQCAQDEKCCPEGCNMVCKKAIHHSIVG
ncbi:hypothetical protein V1264_025131 [Littorina saxatilis]|uniref:WAP domain-containing protein n=1 Tax=Littorina saxatilis TaxID=31220 RepID=A0AAN9ALY2_9CAEN